jgi:drug/metabolite transporter (DMT)-like permease
LEKLEKQKKKRKRKNEMMLIYEIAIIFACILIATAQILFKKFLPNFELKIASIISVLLSPKIILGLFLYFLALLIYLYSLTKLQLNLAYPLLSFSFIFVTIFSFVFLKEKFTIKRLFGILLIILGVALVNL